MAEETLADFVAAANTPDATDTKIPSTPASEPSTTTETTTATAVADDKATDKPAPETETNGEADTESGDLLNWMKETFGNDPDLASIAQAVASENPDDPIAAIRGLLHARRGIKLRDEDAAYGRQLRQLLQGKEQSLAEFLASQSKSNGKETKKTVRELEDFPEDARNWRFQIRQNDKGEYIPVDGAPATIVQDYREYLEARERRLEAIARNWSNLESLPTKVKEEVEKIQAATATEKQSAAMREMESPYREALYIGGNPKTGLTANGIKVDEEYQQQLTDNPGMSPPNALRNALRLVFGADAMKQQKTASKPGVRSVRQAAPAVEKPSYKDLDDELEKRIAGAKSDKEVVAILKEISERTPSLG